MLHHDLPEPGLHHHLSEPDLHHALSELGLDSGLSERLTCCTSRPRAQTSVVISTRVVPARNSCVMASRSFWGMSPWMLLTVKLAARIFSVSQSVCSSRHQLGQCGA